MKSIREIYKIGKGPSSSHTMGPERAAKLFKGKYPQADSFRVILYGSLSKTGVGHGTDRVLREVLNPVETQIVFSKEALTDCHPNTMDFFALQGGNEIGTLRVESIGGGDIRVPGQSHLDSPDVYPENSFAEIADFFLQAVVFFHELVEFVEIGRKAVDRFRRVVEHLLHRRQQDADRITEKKRQPHRVQYARHNRQKQSQHRHDVKKFVLEKLFHGVEIFSRGKLF
jgi:hypothetical protein